MKLTGEHPEFMEEVAVSDSGYDGMGVSSANEGEETADGRTVDHEWERITEFFATALIYLACARRTGFVRRTSKLTGKVFLALVTLGTWSTRQTSLGQLAAKAAHVTLRCGHSPKALHQRMTQRAAAYLRALLQRAFALLNLL